MHRSGRISHVVGLLTILMGICPTAVGQINWSAVHFDSNSDKLGTEEQVILDSLVATYDGTRPHSVTLTGFCDNRGNYQYNLDLSERRAEAVLDYLYEKGFRAYTFLYEGRSFEAPVASNTTEAGRRENRRVEIALDTSEHKGQYIRGVYTDIWSKTLRGRIMVYDSETNHLEMTIIVPNGEFFIPVPKTRLKDLRIVAVAPGHFLAQEDAPRVIPTASGGIDLISVPLEKGKTLRLDNMNFVGSSDEMLPSSHPALEGLLATLRNNPSLKIKLEGHTNGVNTSHEPQWHQELSESRAETVINYLVKNGVKASRLTYEGFGHEHMLFPNAETKEEFRQNRRVEVRVVEF